MQNLFAVNHESFKLWLNLKTTNSSFSQVKLPKFQTYVDFTGANILTLVPARPQCKYLANIKFSLANKYTACLVERIVLCPS